MNVTKQITFATMASSNGTQTIYSVYRCLLQGANLSAREQVICTNNKRSERIGSVLVDKSKPEDKPTAIEMARRFQTPGWPAFSWETDEELEEINRARSERKQRSDAKSALYNDILTALLAGTVIREYIFGGFTDWPRMPLSNYFAVIKLAAHLLNRHQGFSSRLEFDPKLECMANTTAEAAADALAAGYTHVLSLAGPISLADFGARQSMHTSYSFNAELGAIEEGSEKPVEAPFMRGLWMCKTLAVT